MPEPTVFGTRLKHARETRGLTQAELAERANLTSIHVSHFETGVKPSASAMTLVKLANALSVSVDYLLGRTNEMEAVGGPAAVLLRNLGDASAETIDRMAALAKTFADMDQQKRKQGG
jgi:transcriptional regulator with XRE-family HTH domain